MKNILPNPSLASLGNSQGKLSTAITVIEFLVLKGTSFSEEAWYPYMGSAIVEARSVEATGPSISQEISPITLIWNSGCFASSLVNK